MWHFVCKCSSLVYKKWKLALLGFLLFLFFPLCKVCFLSWTHELSLRLPDFPVLLSCLSCLFCTFWIIYIIQLLFSFCSGDALALPRVQCPNHPDAILVEDYRAGDMICPECGLVVGQYVRYKQMHFCFWRTSHCKNTSFPFWFPVSLSPLPSVELR